MADHSADTWADLVGTIQTRRRAAESNLAAEQERHLKTLDMLDFALSRIERAQEIIADQEKQISQMAHRVTQQRAVLDRREQRIKDLCHDLRTIRERGARGTALDD